MIGSFYDASAVVVGQAVGFVATADAPLPSDTTAVWDELTWCGYGIGVGAASAGNITITVSGGPLAAPVTSANIAWNASATVLAGAVTAALPAGYTAVATGTAPTWQVAIVGPGANEMNISATAVALTGGTVLVVPPAWASGGATSEGWTAAYNPTVQDTNIEEQPTPVQQQVTSATLQFTATLSEDTVKSLQLGLSATSNVQAPDTTHYGKTTLSLQPTLPKLAAALEAKNRYGFPRRWYIPEATCAAQMSQAYRRANGQRYVPVTITSVCALSAIQVIEITASHT